MTFRYKFCNYCHTDMGRFADPDPHESVRCQIYMTPFVEPPLERLFCCDKCYDNCYDKDDFQSCEYCSRLIMCRGGESFVRQKDDWSPSMCMSCYTTILNHGEPESNFHEKVGRMIYFDEEALRKAEDKGYCLFHQKYESIAAVSLALIRMGAHVFVQFDENLDRKGCAALYIKVTHLMRESSVALFALRGRLFQGHILCGRDICCMLAKYVMSQDEYSWIDKILEKSKRKK